MPKTKIKKTKLENTPPPAATVISHAGEPFPPHLLLDVALQEKNRRPLTGYHEVIRVLRDEKRFTFREIAEWLNDHNVEADHNSVYREYTKAMPDDVAQGEAFADDQMEREESGH